MVNRVVVTGGYTLDLPLRPGLNIVWGDNGSGKSTFCNLIAYAFGGSIKNFPDEIRYCQSVFVELNINSKILTLERYLNDGSSPLNVYYDSYPPKVAPDRVKVSDLSDRLLSLLGYPRVEIPVEKSGKVSNVTLTFMRLFNWIYFDQDTSAKYIVRNGNHVDVPTRKAITDFFLGVLDVGIYALEKEILQKTREKDKLASRLKTVEEFLQSSQSVGAVSSAQLGKITEELATLQRERSVLMAARAAKSDVVQTMRQELAEIDRKVTACNDFVNATSEKVADLLMLENQLEEDIRTAEQAKVARQVILALAPVRCPSCGMQLAKAKEGECPCCRRPTPIAEITYDTHLIALRGRLSDARVVRKRFEVRKGEVHSEVEELLGRRGKIASKLEKYLADYLTPLAAELNSISESIGIIEGQVEEATQSTSHYQRLKAWRDEISALVGHLTDLEHDRDVAQLMVNRRFDAFDRNLGEFLKDDIYPRLGHVEMDRKRLEPKLDGKLVERITSASDTVVARLAYYIAWHKTSLQGQSTYPRFTLVDTPQDKGLDRPRVEAIVHYLVDMSRQSPVLQQVILTTGVVPDDVDDFIRCRLNKKQGHFLLSPVQSH